VGVSLANFPLDLVVDTGFSGSVLIPFPLFESLGLLSALTLDTYYAVMPDSRRFRLYTAKENVQVGSETTRADVHTSPAINRKLAGRAFLRSFVTTLDGMKEELELRRTEPASSSI